MGIMAMTLVQKWGAAGQDAVREACPAMDDGRFFVASRPASPSSAGTTSTTSTKKWNFTGRISASVLVRPGEKPVHVKVFESGAVQMAGLKAMQDGPRILAFLAEAFGPFCEGKALLGVEYRTTMINSTFALGRGLSLYKFFQNCAGQGHDVAYDPCIYPGVKLRVLEKSDDPSSHKALCAVFQTGSVVITGARCMEHVARARSVVRRLFLEVV